MRVLVAYTSHTGNTKKIAQAIYDAIPQPKEIKRVEDVTSLEVYDFAFLGSPMRYTGPDKRMKAFLETHVKDRTIALFTTHMVPESNPRLQERIQRFRDAAVGANIVGFFNCQGQASRGIKIYMRLSRNPRFRALAKSDSSKGQPDATRLERARTFANETMNRIKL